MRLPTDPTNHLNGAGCVIQAAMCSTFSIASFFWTSVIGLNVFLTVIYNSKVCRVKEVALVTSMFHINLESLLISGEPTLSILANLGLPPH